MLKIRNRNWHIHVYHKTRYQGMQPLFSSLWKFSSFSLFRKPIFTYYKQVLSGAGKLEPIVTRVGWWQCFSVETFTESRSFQRNAGPLTLHQSPVPHIHETLSNERNRLIKSPFFYSWPRAVGHKLKAWFLQDPGKVMVQDLWGRTWTSEGPPNLRGGGGGLAS